MSHPCFHGNEKDHDCICGIEAPHTHSEFVGYCEMMGLEPLESEAQ